MLLLLLTAREGRLSSKRQRCVQPAECRTAHQIAARGRGRVPRRRRRRSPRRQNRRKRRSFKLALTLKKVIFERDRFVTLEVLVLHHKEAPPHLRAFGKIAGQDEIAVIDISGQRGKTGFWAQVIGGSSWVHVTRFIGYIAVLIVVVLCIAGISSGISAIQVRRRRRRVNKVLPKVDGKDSGAARFLRRAYVSHGMEGLIAVQEALKDERQIRRAVRRVRNQREAEKGTKTEESDRAGALDGDGPIEELELPPNFMTPDGYVVLPDGTAVGRRNDGPLRALARQELVTLSPEGKPVVAPGLTDTLDEFIRALK